MMHKYKARRLSVTTLFLGTDNCLIAYGFLLKCKKSVGVINCMEKYASRIFYKKNEQS